MLPTTVVMSGASGQSRAAVAPAVSKDDAWQTEQQPRANDHHPADVTLSMNSPGAHRRLPEFRTGHRSENIRSPPLRLNMYKRMDAPPASPRSHDQNRSQDSSPRVDSSRSEDGNGSPKPFKRESWLQRSWRSARSHRSHTNSTHQLSRETNGKPPVTDRSLVDCPSEPSKKSPLAPHAKPLAGLLERLKQRSGDAASPDRSSMSFGAKRKTGWTTSFDSPQVGRKISPANRWIYERRGSCESPSKEYADEGAWNPDVPGDLRMSPIRRKRSSSDTAKYIIMRKTSRPNTAEVVGSINRRDIAYKQVLKKFTCYDLMPSHGALVAIDSQLSTRHALAALAENGVRAGFIWDSRQRTPVGFVSVTDFLRIMHSHFFACPPHSEPTNGRNGEPQATAHLEDVLEKPIIANLENLRNIESWKLPKRYTLTTISSEDTLLSALTVLRLNRLHRVPVLEPDTGNPLYLLSTKRIFHFLHEYMNILPMTPTLFTTLDELRIGTWADADGHSLSPIVSLTSESSTIEVVEKFRQSGASSIPILKSKDATISNGVVPPKINLRLVDTLTKVDLMHFVLVNGWHDLREKIVADILRQRDEFMERLVTCHKKTTLALAVHKLASSRAHRLYVVDSEGSLEGVISIGDLVSYLTEKAG